MLIRSAPVLALVFALWAGLTQSAIAQEAPFDDLFGEGGPQPEAPFEDLFTDPETRERLDLFSEGARRLMEGLAGEMAPLLLQLEGLVDDLTSYQTPEILPNGDIIIRRRPDAPDLPPPPEGSVDL